MMDQDEQDWIGWTGFVGVGQGRMWELERQLGEVRLLIRRRVS